MKAHPIKKMVHQNYFGAWRSSLDYKKKNIILDKLILKPKSSLMILTSWTKAQKKWISKWNAYKIDVKRTAHVWICGSSHFMLQEFVVEHIIHAQWKRLNHKDLWFDKPVKIHDLQCLNFQIPNQEFWKKNGAELQFNDS
jgi:hypothetical protein